ncbi:hypothetical protein O3G_MSEX004079 [Manduca sexta]|uniref:Uncharacterized protein n=1 Tax=Manduca sexta TaxID=7130 RepID=A0A921YUB1_MANSE|nr:hypothetical protein O3G_MSEX004079 [Manduca sexta]
MSESDNGRECVDQDQKHEHNPRKRIRHRKKQLYENILKQMEFYFSDANLNKDRFLGDLVNIDPYVSLDIFLKFNKIRSMTQDVNDIIKAMKHSTFLELSEDKLKVKRKTPVLPYDVDARTVYVESIPVTASREWLERVFSDYGKVVYISLPKFKNSQKIKGYGFVEFNKPEEAQKCIHKFTKMGCKLPTCMQPDELTSIKMFSVDEPTDGTEIKETRDDYEPPKKKRKKIRNRRRDENKSITTPTEENKTITDVESKDEMTSQDELKDDPDTPRKKKNRKRTAKDKVKGKNGLGKNEAPKGALWGLQVLSKSEWKALRNKYLNLQRKNMKILKTNLRNNRHAYSSIPAPAAPSVEVGPASSSEAESGKIIATVERIPGVFVKEILPEPCLDVRLTKRTIRSNIHALHVDVKEGQTEVFIRFDSAKAADEYCSNSGNLSRVLSGAEESEQWTRLEAGRAARRPRGRARLERRLTAAPAGIAPASPQPTHTHIRFDE